METFITGVYIFVIISLTLLFVILGLNKSKENRILSLFVLAHSVVLTFNILVYKGSLDQAFYFIAVVPSTLIGPLALIYCQLLLDRKNTIQFGALLPHFIIPITFPVLFGVFNLHSFFGHPSFLSPVSASYPLFMQAVIFLHVPAYYVYCWIYCQRKLRTISSEDSAVKLKIKWTRDFVLSLLIFVGVFIIIHLTMMLYNRSLEVDSALASPFVVLSLYIFIVSRAIGHNPLFNSDKVISLNPAQQKPEFYLSGEGLNELEAKLMKTLETEKLFKNKNLTIALLSRKLGTSPKSVSYLINSRYQVNFNDFINRYRVEEAVRMMSLPESEMLKLEVIAEEAGFNSRATFFSQFKKIKGQTPAMFRKRLIDS